MRAWLAALLLFAFAARADVKDFYGNWENPARDASGLTHVVISPDGGVRVSVRAYGNCHPIECDWGLVAGRSYSAGPGSGAVEAIQATFNAGFARRLIIFRVLSSGGLGLEMLTEFSDGSGRHDFITTGTLHHSAWAGPVSQNWERPAALGSGWGGGARGGASPKPMEACSGFDPAAVEAEERGGSWEVVAGPQTLVDAGPDEKMALQARDAIRHYRFDRKCTLAGAPAGAYWKHGQSFPQRKIGGLDCVAFNPTTVHAARIGRSWKVVDGVEWIAEPGADKAKTDSLLALIRFYRLDTACFLRRPDPVMAIWLAR